MLWAVHDAFQIVQVRISFVVVKDNSAPRRRHWPQLRAARNKSTVFHINETLATDGQRNWPELQASMNESTVFHINETLATDNATVLSYGQQGTNLLFST